MSDKKHKSLVIVESPAKAKTIAGYLGNDFVVSSSIGHVRDLPDRASEIPAAVKKEHAGEYKELQASIKDINAMLPAQRERLDSLCLAQRSWPIAVW